MSRYMGGVYDMDALLGSGGPDLENFSLQFDVPGGDADDVERLSDDLEYDEQEIERNTIHIPEDDLNDLDDSDNDDVNRSPMSERFSGMSDDIFNDSDSDIFGNDDRDDHDDDDGASHGDDLYDEARDSFDSVTLDSVMSDLNFEFGSLTDTPAIEVENYFENPDDEYELPVSSGDPLSMRRVSIDHSAATLSQATGAMYKLIWEEGLLGLRLKMTSLFLPAVTKLTGKSSMLGIHLVEIGDYLVRIGDQETHRMNFRDVIDLLKVAQKPAALTFRRASDSAAPPMEKDLTSKGTGAYAWKSSIAQRIAARLEELQAEEKAKESQAPSIDMDNKYPVFWEEGPLGVSLVANKDVPYPQVTRITGKNRSAQVKDIVPGHYLISIGNYDTSSGTFNAAIKQLHEVIKPATLYFAPDLRQVSLRPEIGQDEYEQGWEKKQPLGFTLKCAPYGTIVADVGVAKTAKTKQGKTPSSPTSASMRVGDQLVWVNDDCVDGIEFHEVLKTLRQAKRPLQLRFRREKAAIELKLQASKKQLSPPPTTVPPPPPSTSNGNKKDKHDGIPFTTKLSSALKDAVKMGKPKPDDGGKRHSITPEKNTSRGFFGKQQQQQQQQQASNPTGTSERSKRSSLHSPRQKQSASATTPDKHHRTVHQLLDSPAPISSPPPLASPPLSSPPPPSSSVLNGPISSSTAMSLDKAHAAIVAAAAATAAAALELKKMNLAAIRKSEMADMDDNKPPASSSSGTILHPLSVQPQSTHRSSPPKEEPTTDVPVAKVARSSSHPPESSSKGGISFEYEITWSAGQELGVTLKPHPESRRAVVSRVTGNNDNTKRMALGDILLGANGIPFTPQQKLNDTLSMLATMPKPVVLRFLRPAKPVYPTSSRSASHTPARQEYALEWPDKCRLGLLFSAHPMTNAPFVSRMEYQNADDVVCPPHLKQVHLGDILVHLGDTDLRGLPFDQCIQALTVVTRPVTMRFRRGDLIPQAPVPKSTPHRKNSNKSSSSHSSSSSSTSTSQHHHHHHHATPPSPSSQHH
ncbi:hypothetical protein SPRG_10575 [Saprolegnia parasitica CBS 223.65]|uniref:PDZ domain-containing protein n=1 Tax=Saprolegnia parasitica (strain CBS 223.65) TaxID=695850 RepID=A0A067C0V1_SAPPC|nr:hypothetical protein SPRG_10575 [Saprolegnia parasitica CBS 223.65]KDO24148.1 hypothetical protein SPRG_10575 [Saprolegnia parasitica CBS 223.65]|eukprot:XP_012205092.1 hypothetical protein SPRG_10575 [Saprolegnia parasitica CBS 223.65]